MHKENSVSGASIILIVTLFLSNILGVVRDHYLSQKIPTDLLSVYYAAFRIPDLIFNILILGAITSAFIPVFTNLVSRGKKNEAWDVAVSVINIAIVFLIAITALLALLMPLVTPLIVPGFSAQKQELTLKLARLMLLSPIFFGLSYILGGILNSFKRFLVYSLAPLVYNLTIILGTVLLADSLGIFGVALAVVAGAFLHFLIQLPAAIKTGLKYHFKILWQHWGVRRIGILMVPRAIALGANQILLLVFTAIASSIGGYAVAVYNLADNIQTMPMVVFGTSFATAIFPTLAEAVSRDKMAEFAGQIERVGRIILFFMLPMTVILILLRAEIVRLILGSGHFGWEQTKLTANTLGVFALSLVFAGLMPLFSRAFYALHNTRVPMIVTLVGVAISIVLGKIFAQSEGVVGLALGFSIGTAISAATLYLLLRKRVVFSGDKATFFFILKIVFAGVLMTLAMQESKVIIGVFVNMQRFWGVAAKAGGALTIGSAVYLISCWIFSCEEIRSIGQVFQKYSRRVNGRE